MEQQRGNIGTDDSVSNEVIIPTAEESMMIRIGRALNPAFDADAFVRTARLLARERQQTGQYRQVH